MDICRCVLCDCSVPMVPFVDKRYINNKQRGINFSLVIICSPRLSERCGVTCSERTRSKKQLRAETDRHADTASVPSCPTMHQQSKRKSQVPEKKKVSTKRTDQNCTGGGKKQKLLVMRQSAGAQIEERHSTDVWNVLYRVHFCPPHTVIKSTEPWTSV